VGGCTGVTLPVLGGKLMMDLPKCVSG